MLLYAFSVFLLPIILAFIGYFTANALFESAVFSVLSALTFFVLTFFVIWLIWGRKDTNTNITMTEIKGDKND